MPPREVGSVDADRVPEGGTADLDGSDAAEIHGPPGWTRRAQGVTAATVSEKVTE
jgi:hypothetical protein